MFVHGVGVHDTPKQTECSTTGKGIGVEEAPLGGERRVVAMKGVPEYTAATQGDTTQSGEIAGFQLFLSTGRGHTNDGVLSSSFCARHWWCVAILVG